MQVTINRHPSIEEAIQTYWISYLLLQFMLPLVFPKTQFIIPQLMEAATVTTHQQTGQQADLRVTQLSIGDISRSTMVVTLKGL
jgi:hypothetical protein